MARPLRVEYPDALYHITVRGNARQKSFLKQNTEIPKEPSYIARKELAEIFQEGSRSGTPRDELIYQAFKEYDYYQKEIADFLGIHYATISRAIKKVEEKK